MNDQENAGESTRLALAKACRPLMARVPVGDLTVTQICAAARLSRQTFYRCFLDKYDLINWYFDRLLHESFSQLGSGKTIREGLILKFRYIAREDVFFRAAFATDTQNNLRDHDFAMILAFYKDLISRSGRPVAPQVYDILEMYCQSSVYMTVKWVLAGCRETPEALADLMIAALPEGLEELFRKLKIRD